MEYTFEKLHPDHKEAIVDIFNYYIDNGYAAYAEERITTDYYKKIAAICDGYPAIIPVSESGEVAGFSLLRPYKPHPTFSHTAEITYFIKQGHTGKGLGAQLLDRLIEEGRKMGITCLLANISSLNEGSIAFHKKNGFVECGRFKGVIRKKGKTFDVVWMQRMI